MLSCTRGRRSVLSRRRVFFLGLFRCRCSPPHYRIISALGRRRVDWAAVHGGGVTRRWWCRVVVESGTMKSYFRVFNCQSYTWHPSFGRPGFQLLLWRRPSSAIVFVAHRVTIRCLSACGAVLLVLPARLQTPPSPRHNGFPEADAVGRHPIGRGVEQPSWYVLADESLS